MPPVGGHSPGVLSHGGPWPGVQHLRGADALEASLVEGDGGIAAAAALIVVALEAAATAAALAVGSWAQEQQHQWQLGFSEQVQWALAVARCPCKGRGSTCSSASEEEELLQHRQEHSRRTTSLPCTIWRANAHSGYPWLLHDGRPLLARLTPPLPEFCAGVPPPRMRPSQLGGGKRLAVMRPSQVVSLLGSPRAGIYIDQPQAICLCHNPLSPHHVSPHKGEAGGWDQGGSGRKVGTLPASRGPLQKSVNAESILEV